LFRAIYTISLSLLYIAAIPFILLFITKEKYRRSLPSRFFLWNNPPLERDGIWFHACSYGEAKAIKPLVEKFDPSEIRLSTTTQTGYEIISRLSKNHSRYLPFEPLLHIWIGSQKALIVAEAELWYLLFHLARDRGAATFLINARISERSFPRYKAFKWLYRRIFDKIDHIYAQSEDDRSRLVELGAKDVKVVGNIKFSHIGGPVDPIEIDSTDVLNICAASTHENEEGLILDAFGKLDHASGSYRLIVVPRHPERFDRVYDIIEKHSKSQGFRCARFSETGRIGDADIVMIDAMGKLQSCMAVSDIVVMGGAFEPHGGHNAAEAARFSCKIISGPHYFNQKELFSKIEGITICEKDELAEVLKKHDSLPYARIESDSDPAELIYRDICNVLHDK